MARETLPDDRVRDYAESEIRKSGLKVGHRIVHAQTGRRYRVEAFAMDSSCCGVRVLYRADVPAMDLWREPMWDRPLEEFFEFVENQGRRVRRFRRVDA